MRYTITSRCHRHRHLCTKHNLVIIFTIILNVAEFHCIVLNLKKRSRLFAVYIYAQLGHRRIDTGPKRNCLSFAQSCHVKTSHWPKNLRTKCRNSSVQITHTHSITHSKHHTQIGGEQSLWCESAIWFRILRMNERINSAKRTNIIKINKH